MPTNGVLVLVGATNTDNQLLGTLNNAGTIRLATGNLQIVGAAAGASGELINLPGALVNFLSDVSIDNYSGERFVNQGVVRKSGGTGVSQIKPFFYNSGAIDAQTGTISLVGSGSMAGAQLSGAGTNTFASGSYTLSGIINSSNAVLAGATLTGSNGVLSGTWTWNSGSIANGSTLAVATNGVLVLAGVTKSDNQLLGTLTSAGTIRAANLGMLGAGGLDRWEFTACVGDWLYPQFTTTNFIASLGVYGPDGALLAPGYGTNINFALQATNCGTFTFLITSASEGGVGAYSLFPNGLSDGTKLCPPAITAPVLTLIGVGGATNSQFILYTTTNVPAPAGLWTSIYTNRFDQSGVFNYTNSFAPSAGRAFFRLRLQ